MRASRSLIARWERTTSAHDVPASSDSAGEDAQMGQLRIWASGGRGTAGAVECSPGWKGEHIPTTPAILQPPPAAASRTRSGGEAGRSSFVVRRRVMVGRLFEVGEPRALLSTAPEVRGAQTNIAGNSTTSGCSASRTITLVGRTRRCSSTSVVGRLHVASVPAGGHRAPAARTLAGRGRLSGGGHRWSGCC